MTSYRKVPMKEVSGLLVPPRHMRGLSRIRLPSLPEVNGSVRIPDAGGFLRKFVAFFGPGYLVAVGYMGPGNWATSLAGGSAFGYTLLSVALLSSLMAILLQALCARMASPPAPTWRSSAASASPDPSSTRSGFWPRWRSAPPISPNRSERP
jgi:hypothetical protein